MLLLTSQINKSEQSFAIVNTSNKINSYLNLMCTSMLIQYTIRKLQISILPTEPGGYQLRVATATEKDERKQYRDPV